MFIAVMTWDAQNRVTKYQGYATEAEAAAHVERFAGRFPAAFVAESPGGPDGDWLVDDGTLVLQERTPVDGLTLQAAQTWAAGLVDRARLARECGSGEYARVSVEVGGVTIPADTRDERDLNRLDTLGGLATLALVSGDATPFRFKDADNAYHDLVPAELAQMLVGVAHAIHARAVAWSWQVKDAIAAARTASDVLAIVKVEGLA